MTHTLAFIITRANYIYRLLDCWQPYFRLTFNVEWRHVRVNSCVPFVDKLDLCQHKMKRVCSIHEKRYLGTRK